MNESDIPNDSAIRRVRLTGRLAEYFGNPQSEFLIVGGALTTAPCFGHFGESFAHIYPRGVIRHGTCIAGIEDLELVPESVTV